MRACLPACLPALAWLGLAEQPARRTRERRGRAGGRLRQIGCSRPQGRSDGLSFCSALPKGSKCASVFGGAAALGRADWLTLPGYAAYRMGDGTVIELNEHIQAG